jgi:hypothetical protein
LQRPKPTNHFIELALRKARVWDFGNEILYKLCATHPDHATDEVIIAKFWLIGRAYSAAVERRRVRDNLSADQFYVTKLAPRVRESGIDDWFKSLREDIENKEAVALQVHGKLTALLYPPTELKKRSLASKYLHFHFPDRFFLYDSRARKSVRALTPKPKQEDTKEGEIDAEYGDFFHRCNFLVREIRSHGGRELTPRELDDVLLAWN